MGRQQQTADLGAWSEYMVAAGLARLGCPVYWPRAGQSEADLVFGWRGRSYALQVKTSAGQRFDLRSRSHTKAYTEGAFDFFALVTATGRVYLLPHDARQLTWTLTPARRRAHRLERVLDALPNSTGGPSPDDPAGAGTG